GPEACLHGRERTVFPAVANELRVPNDGEMAEDARVGGLSARERQRPVDRGSELGIRGVVAWLKALQRVLHDRIERSERDGSRKRYQERRALLLGILSEVAGRELGGDQPTPGRQQRLEKIVHTPALSVARPA